MACVFIGAPPQQIAKLHHPPRRCHIKQRNCRSRRQRPSSATMIPVPTNPPAHYAGDLAAWVAAALAARWQYRRWPEQARNLSRITRPSYFIALAIGALVGAWLLGSAN